VQASWNCPLIISNLENAPICSAFADEEEPLPHACGRKESREAGRVEIILVHSEHFNRTVLMATKSQLKDFHCLIFCQFLTL
jgi:hypothetical protein